MTQASSSKLFSTHFRVEGRSPGERGTEAGEKRAGSEIPKVVEPGEIEKKIAWDKEKGTTTEKGGKWEKKVREVGVRSTGSRRFRHSCPPIFDALLYSAVNTFPFSLPLETRVGFSGVLF